MRDPDARHARNPVWQCYGAGSSHCLEAGNGRKQLDRLHKIHYAPLAAYYSGNKEGVQQAADKAANEPAPESAITLALAQTAAVQ